jgi:hypothetical protein
MNSRIEITHTNVETLIIKTVLHYGEVNDLYFLKTIANTIRLDKSLVVDEDEDR